MSSTPRTRTLGPYELFGKPLGAGAQGEVFRARKNDSSDYVALKLFRLGVDEEVIEGIRKRVRREVDVLQKCQHPAIVRALDSGEAPATDDPANNGYLYIAYELVVGCDLTEALARPLPPEPPEVVNLLFNLAAGLQLVHEQGVIHRDIKPGNIRLRTSDWADPVLVDFGSVRLQGASSFTGSIGAQGTPGYMAREVVQSARNAVAASDQYSLSCVALEAIAVVLNESFEDARGQERRDLLGAVVKPTLPNVAVVLERALLPAPQERFPSILAFARELGGAAVRDSWIDHVDLPGGDAAPVLDGESLAEFFARLDLPTVDKRHVTGGNLWVIAGAEEFQAIHADLSKKGIYFNFAPHGGRASKGQPAWFTASRA